MATHGSSDKYDEVLASILVNEKSILGFLSTIFNFLARRTDFYYVPEGAYENMGFPPGVAEELVLKVLKACDPKSFKPKNGSKKPTDVNNEIMCSTVAQEVEVIAEEEQEEEEEVVEEVSQLVDKPEPFQAKEIGSKDKVKGEVNYDDYTPPVIPVQKNSETYNGADRDIYLWAQTIMELDVTVKLPPNIKSSKDLKVTINSGDISVASRAGEVIMKDTLPYKIKASDCFWSISEGKLLMHLEKAQERWWDKLLNSEEPIDLNKIDCSRSIDELPDDHVAKVRELQWNQEQKLKGLPTSDEIRNMGLLKKAWNAEGSPFQGQPFDPSVLSKNQSLQ